jgi:NADP-reducing hydrogenase subunit HndB
VPRSARPFPLKEVKVPVVKSLEDLKRLREEALEKRQAKATGARVQITAFMGTCGIAAGARETMKAILDIIEAEDLPDILVKQTGCIGLCSFEPIVEVEITDQPKVRYGKVSPERARRIMRDHVIGGQPVAELTIPIEEQGPTA